jgi:hypothetical protein
MIKPWRIRLAEHELRIREKKNLCRILMEKPEGNKLLGGSVRRWVHNINMDPGERERLG